MKKTILSLICLIAFLNFANGQNLISNGEMESEEGWTIYQLADVATSYEFNYTAELPVGGVGGCLRLMQESAENEVKNIIFWQTITLTAGKPYLFDANVKLADMTEFWFEVYLSTEVPVDGEDFAPNENADRIAGYSSWIGCGPNINGTMSETECIGKSPFIVPGTEGEEISYTFAIKAGSNHMVLDVLVDNISLILEKNGFLIGTANGILDVDNLKITGVSPSIGIADFVDGLEYPSTAQLLVIDSSTGEEIAPTNDMPMSNNIVIRVVGNQTTDYAIEVRDAFSGNDILSLLNATIDTEAATVSALPNDAKVFQLKASIDVSNEASYELLSASDSEINDDDLISADLQIKVTAENGDPKTFSLTIGAQGLPVVDVQDVTETFERLDDNQYNLSGAVSWIVTAIDRPFKGGIVNLQSEDAWVYFKGVRPRQFNESYMKHLLVNGVAAVLDENIRLAQWGMGTAVVAHSPSIKPLEVFTEENVSGNSMELELYTYYKSSELGDFNDAVKSFTLKKGYMATFAQDEEGTGYSKVFIADQEDLTVNALPDGLYAQSSFVRVFPWSWFSKKGKAGDVDNEGHVVPDMLNCSWVYDWNNEAQSSLNIEYIPMRHNPGWNAFENINVKKNTTHALGYNEPDNSGDDGFSTVEGAIEMWPNLLASGLRLGSPAPTDGGRDWLYRFIDRCEELNYRVDVAVIHWYWGGSTAIGYYNFLKEIHERTGRPIWITEWNNGANWTCCLPTYEEQAKTIGEMLYMLDTTSFVERHALYEWVEDQRRLITDDDELTLAGEVFRDFESGIAYNAELDYSKEFHELAGKAFDPTPAHTTVNTELTTQLSWTAGSLAEKHILYLDTEYPPASRIDTLDLGETSYTAGDLTSNTKYHWQVNELYNGNANFGDIWEFTTMLVTKVDDELNYELNAYPQPVSDVLMIQGLDFDSEVEIYNLSGRQMLKQKTMNGSLNLNALSNGLYVLKIDGYKSMKIIKRN